MAFTVNDVRDLVHLLAEHPEWRAELRPLILGDEILRLPAAIEALAEAQRRTEARVEELAEAQRRTEARVEELAEAQRRTEGTLSELVQAQRSTEASMKALVEEQRRQIIRLDRLDGRMTELRFRTRGPSYFGTWLARPRVIDLQDLPAFDAAEEAGTLSERDMEQLSRVDFLVRGRDKREPGRPDTVLAIEISLTIDREDVVRADTRAQILRSLGLRAFGAVGGEAITPRATESAKELQVLVKVVADD